jgi:hypothetical protein
VTGGDERLRVEEALRRIDDLVGGLSHVADPAARESARQLLEAVLDLHGLALARIMAVIAGAEDGRELLARLGDDEQVNAVLLLYGLHPEEPLVRLRRVLEQLQSKLAAHGVTAELVRVNATGSLARLTASAGLPETIRREVEDAIGNAVPDLDEVAVEWLDTDAPAAAAE